MKNIMPYNENRKAHGYWEWYYTNGSLWFKRFYNNNKIVGYEEHYYCSDNKLSTKTYFI